MSELGKPFLKKPDQKIKNRKSMSKCRMLTKKQLARNGYSVEI